ncbi:MAG: hypothetical protein SWH61_08670 [Thermodesulfobacteriota bacterium]|nr:hypothetical protein [Thermodesulfobacteriota bacterium]
MKKISILMTAGLLFLLFSGFGVTSSAAVKKLTVPCDQEKLESGEIQVFTHRYTLKDGGEGKRVIGIMLLDAPPAQVWKVLENWDAMGPYVKSLKYYKTIHVINPVSDIASGVSLIEGKLKVGILSFLYTLRVTFDRVGYSQEWRMLTSDEIVDCKKQQIPIRDSSASIKDIRGFEYIEPYGDGSKTIYWYAPVVEVSGLVPGWVERAISKSSLNEYMEAVRKMVQSQ